jgi:hypothetical protein
MRAITVAVLFGLAALAAGYVAPQATKEVKYADKDFLMKQKIIFDLFAHLYTYDDHTEYYNDAQKWKFEQHYDKYTNVEAIKEFVRYYDNGMMEKDEVFSIMYEEHRDYAVSLFHVFYYAKDWDTFYQSMVWASYHVNPGMFVYALSVAVIHRPDMAGMELPAPYEIYPYYFFNTEVIHKAHIYKFHDFEGVKKTEGLYDVVIPENHTHQYISTNEHQIVSYFTEDIGLNTYYYYFNLDYPFWMGGQEFNLYKDRRGELYLFEHQQLLARYYMERLSNKLGEIHEYSYWNPIETGYYPNLRYYNGLYFPTRENTFDFYKEHNYYEIMEIEDIEARIRDAIDFGFVFLPDGTHIDLTKPESIDILGNMIQGNPDWPHWRFYKYLTVYSKILLGSTMEQKGHFDVKSSPSVLEHFETSMRDPLFYMLYKRLIKYYWQFKDHLPEYTHDELLYKGVKIESVEMDKLVTYFDKYDSDITNAVKYGYVSEKDYHEDYVIKARQTRLNHLPFTFKLNVNSQVTGKSVVRVFLGPKYDSVGQLIELDDMRENFWYMDSFVYELKSGKNTIERHSEDFAWFVQDRTPLYKLYKWVMGAISGSEKFPLDMTEAHCGFPDRLMLPKGWKSGMPYQFFFMITPYAAPQQEQYSTYNQVITCGIGSGSRFIDSLPFGYPFDREIDENYWFTPNMYYYDTMIFHKKEIKN